VNKTVELTKKEKDFIDDLMKEYEEDEDDEEDE
jgi:hypothetical protein